MRIYLVRHGQTKANEERRYTGSSDISLSSKGRILLKEIKEDVDYLDGLPVYLSALKRTKETALLLFPHSKIVEELPFMNETNFGDFEGKRYTDLKSDRDYLRWINDIYSEVPKNGESYNVFKDRVVDNFLEHIIGVKEDSIYVTHGGVIRVIMSSIVDESIPFFNWDIPNGKGYCLHVLEGKILRYEKI